VIGSLYATVCAAAAVGAQERAPTFATDVAPILYARCVECHRSGEIGPMPLITYEEVRPWARAIRARVLDRSMPPWLADPVHDTLANDRRLTRVEMDTIARWVDAGARKGNATMPPAPTYADGWVLGTPDLVLSMPEAFDVPADGTIPMKNFVVATGLTEDRWLRAVEVRPGARAVVHHLVAIAQPPNANRSPNLDDMQLDLLAAGGPGEHAAPYPPGTGKLLRAGSNVVLQIHYTANGTAVRDRSQVGLYFASAPPERALDSHLFETRDFLVPAGHPDYEVTTSWTVDDDIHITDLAPHMHLRGKDFTFRLIEPDGRSTDLLRVPKFDFSWQVIYRFEQPVAVRRGSRIEAIGHFDNSAANKRNPNPKKAVGWGEQTWDEMLAGWITFTRDAERIAAPR